MRDFMRHSRRGLFKFGTSLLGSLLIKREGWAQELHQSPEAGSRSEVERLAQIFEYGVASGDPLADRVILWTRVTGDGTSPVQVRWQVSLDASFMQLVAEGETEALAEHDFTVKVDALLPYAATSYYYRFFALDCWSMVGRTRTAPREMQNIRLALVSCSSIWSGYFNAYEALARRNDIDAILHVGDYIYDFVDEDEQRNMPADPINSSNPETLEAVRQRYRFYRKDPFLRHAHQQHPWLIVWDNHDIDHRAGREASLRAFHEWQPIRSPDPGNQNLIHRRLSFGPMLDLIMLDTRHIGRNSESRETGARSILGDEQFHWLKSQLVQSQAHWRILGNQVLMAPCKILGQPISGNMWDGYAADRERVLRVLVEHGIANTLVATGDAHLSFGANLVMDGQAAAVEFLPSSVTRGNLDEQVKGILGSVAKGGFAAAIKLFNSHIRYFESTRHGYGLMDLTQNAATLEFWYVPHEELGQEQELGRALQVDSGRQSITKENVPASEGRKRASPAPAEPRLYQSPGEVGGQGGAYFDDAERLHFKSRLVGLRVRSGDRIDAITAIYEDGCFLQHGGGGGREQTLDLDSGEYVRRLTLGVGKRKNSLSIHYMKLSTSQGRILEAGKRPAATMDFVAGPGRHIIGFRGRAGEEIDKLGPIFAPDFNSW
jgi:alkaline phosphatase D